MKTILLSLFTILIFTVSNAQLVTITGANQMPQIGDTVKYINANSFGFVVDGTGPVTNTLWDFAALMNTGTTIDYWYSDASLTPQGANYPNANIARENSDAAGYDYYETTGTQINRWGMYIDPTQWINNRAPATEFQFPITAGGSYNCAYTGDFAPWGMGEDSVVVESGQIIVNADRQGTLILPNGTYQDVLRLHLIESFHITTYMFGTPALDNLVEDDYYYWFVETKLQPILVYGVTSIDGSAQPEVLRYQESCNYFFPETYSICDGDNYLWHGTTYTTAGIYYDNDTTTLGCDSIYELTLSVNPNPVIDLGADTMICDYETIVLDAGSGFTTYQWSTGGSGQTYSLDSTGIGIGTTIIGVAVTDGNGCINSDTISVTFDDCTFIDDISDKNINIYPNPTEGKVFIEGDFEKVEILNILGEKLSESFENVIDLKAYKQSFYILSVSTKHGIINKKIILSR